MADFWISVRPWPSGYDRQTQMYRPAERMPTRSASLDPRCSTGEEGASRLAFASAYAGRSARRRGRSTACPALGRATRSSLPWHHREWMRAEAWPASEPNRTTTSTIFWCVAVGLDTGGIPVKGGHVPSGTLRRGFGDGDKSPRGPQGRYGYFSISDQPIFGTYTYPFCRLPLLKIHHSL